MAPTFPGSVSYQECVQAGRDAFADCCPEDACPFEVGTLARAWWRRGWWAAFDAVVDQINAEVAA